jgi:5-methylcytosine-specific restriction endonuclease McrA
MMLIEILQVPHLGSSILARRMLRVKCDECGLIVDRRWQREVAEQLHHFCCRQHSSEWAAKQPYVKAKIIAANRRPEIRSLHSARATLQWTSPKFSASVSTGVRERNLHAWATPSYREQHSGANHYLTGQICPWWKPWMSDIQDMFRWNQKIMMMFDSCCAICGTNQNMCVHHIAPQALYPNLRYDLSNGVALCKECHTGKNNVNNVHRLLRTDPNGYQTLMRLLQANAHKEIKL